MLKFLERKTSKNLTTDLFRGHNVTLKVKKVRGLEDESTLSAEHDDILHAPRMEITKKGEILLDFPKLLNVEDIEATKTALDDIQAFASDLKNFKI